MTEKKENNRKEKLPIGVTAEMVKAWKERYGEKKVKKARIKDDDNVFEPFDVVIRRPGRTDMSEFEKWIDKRPDKAKELLIKACVLSPNKEEILADEDKFLMTFNAVAEMLPISKVEIKNL